jgi:predicted NUDIX family phosphoesterase
MIEQVLVVPRIELDRRGLIFQGFREGGVEEVLEVVRRAGCFVPRPEAEEDPSRKQIIPYGVVACRDLVFLMRRSRKGGDARLHEKLTIGVGGHVNPEDAVPGPGDAPERALEREIGEEIVIEARSRKVPVGLLNDDSNPVGSVHLGLVYRIELDEPRVRVREEDLLTGELVPASSLAGEDARMETWSRILRQCFWPS